jgi:hypothetical protein
MRRRASGFIFHRLATATARALAHVVPADKGHQVDDQIESNMYLVVGHQVDVDVNNEVGSAALQNGRAHCADLVEKCTAIRTCAQ